MQFSYVITQMKAVKSNLTHEQRMQIFSIHSFSVYGIEIGISSKVMALLS